MIYLESIEQKKLVAEFNKLQSLNIIPSYLILTANRLTQKLTKTQQARAKAEGMVAGIPDLILYAMSDGYGALLIEMKSPKVKPKTSKGKGGVSETQSEMHVNLRKAGYKVVVCYSGQEAIEQILLYLKTLTVFEMAENRDNILNALNQLGKFNNAN